MNILNLGSLNIDLVYKVDHFVCEGETLLSGGYDEHIGGKGLNQSVALSRAGAKVYHAGAIGKSGQTLKDALEKYGVQTQLLQTLDCPSGHAVIQVLASGKNCILVYGGANQKISRGYIDNVLGSFNNGDILLLQNEISNVAYAIKKAKSKGLKVVFNPSPITKSIVDYPLDIVDIFILNEIEAKALTQKDIPAAILDEMSRLFPKADIVLTLGQDGAMFKNQKESISWGIYKTEVVDTTAAGDTFCGFFISAMTKGFLPKECLKFASAASALAISKNGAAESIPSWKEVKDFLS
ncbi:MAG: ribokinase [Elusimicrobiota bacterium]|jgi:ribokinase|nr:ribokinase [Elusimicrobiota bacterium]